jgi:hypothetical protein
MSVTSRDIRTPLPGHAIINVLLALGLWLVGVFFTATILPIDPTLGPFIPWMVAVAIQLLLTAGQANLRILGVTLAGWPFVAMTIADVLINMAGLLMTYSKLDSLGDVALYTIRAALSGVGLWQVALALFVGALIAAAPEQMIRASLKR